VTELEGWLTAAAGSWQERLQLSAAQEHGSWDGLHSGGAKVWYACAYAYVCLGGRVGPVLYVWRTEREGGGRGVVFSSGRLRLVAQLRDAGVLFITSTRPVCG